MLQYAIFVVHLQTNVSYQSDLDTLSVRIDLTSMSTATWKQA